MLEDKMSRKTKTQKKIVLKFAELWFRPGKKCLRENLQNRFTLFNDGFLSSSSPLIDDLGLLTGAEFDESREKKIRVERRKNFIEIDLNFDLKKKERKKRKLN